MEYSKNEKCIIWGAGYGGRKAYSYLNNIEQIEILCFCDNNSELWGATIDDVPICDFFSLKPDSYDYIVVGVLNAVDEVCEQLYRITDKPIILNWKEMVERRFSIDISGCCNARCRWCSTGRKNLKKGFEGHYMSFDMFVQIYNHMCKIGLLRKYNEILLYSWGEPFLNPDYERIILFLRDNHQIFSLSTNASVPKFINDEKRDCYSTVKTIVFSMPGFSQYSYNQMHGFRLETIKSNIKEIMKNLNQNGFHGNSLISYHLYRNNIDELKSAYDFATELGIEIVPIVAYFASYELAKEYLLDSMDESDICLSRNDLFLNHVRKLIKDRPKEYRCLVENVISIHFDGRIELCCCCDDSADDFLWTNILSINSLSEWNNYRAKMLQSNTCLECRELGIDYWFFNNDIETKDLCVDEIIRKFTLEEGNNV